MNITLKRNYKLILGIFVILGVSFVFSGTRIISYNFGDYEVVAKGIGYNYENEIDLLDESLVHEIFIDISESQYDAMVQDYQENSEKSWQKVDVTIDGVKVSNVGIRLKGNLTLRTVLGGNMGGMGGGQMGERPNFENGEFPNFPEGEMPNFGNIQNEKNNNLEENIDEEVGEGLKPSLTENNPENIQSIREQMMGGNSSRYSFELPGFLLDFDKYNEGQSYQGLTRVALRIGNDTTFLNELVAYKIYEDLGYIAPDAVYSAITFGSKGTFLYDVSETLNDEYVEKYFPEENGVLYKAGNSVGFHYEGDDPSLYAEKFEVASGKNKNDLSPLIKILKFVTESSDEEFAQNIENYVDLENLFTIMAVDEAIGNTDGFAGLGSNFYIFVNTDEGKAYFLPWDYNLSFGGMGGGMGQRGNFNTQNITNAENNLVENNPPDFSQVQNSSPLLRGTEGDGENTNIQNENNLNNGEQNTQNQNNFRTQRQNANLQNGEMGQRGGFGGEGNGGMGRNTTNDLKTKLLANEKYSEMYNAKLAEVKEKIYTDGIAKTWAEYYENVFFSYENYEDLGITEDYNSGFESIKNYIETQTNSLK